MTKRVTLRQHEVLDHLTERGALSRTHAQTVFGADEKIAENLTLLGILNKRYAADGTRYWIRGKDEGKTGISLPAGFIVILNRNVTTPTGKSENLFLARACYDGKGPTFRHLLRGWLRTLGLQPKDLIGGFMGFEKIEADSPVFQGDHVILDTLTDTPPY